MTAAHRLPEWLAVPTKGQAAGSIPARRITVHHQAVLKAVA